jgi:hypothetical protein
VCINALKEIKVFSIEFCDLFLIIDDICDYISFSCVEQVANDIKNTNDNHSWMGKIINKIHVHPFTHPMCIMGVKTWLSASKVGI